MVNMGYAVKLVKGGGISYSYSPKYNPIVDAMPLAGSPVAGKFSVMSNLNFKNALFKNS